MGDVKKNLFSLNAQINFVSDKLRNAQSSSLNKIKDAFKNTNELNIVKEEITSHLSDLAEGASQDIKQEVESLQNRWNILKNKLEEENEITSILQGASSELKEQMNKVYEKGFLSNLSIVKEETGFDKISQAVQSYFERATKPEIIQEKYPLTIKAIYRLALDIYEGKYGESIKELFQNTENSSKYIDLFLLLLLVNYSHSKDNPQKKLPCPEIFLSLQMTPSYKKVVQTIENLEFNEIEEVLFKDERELTSEQKIERNEIHTLFTYLKSQHEDIVALNKIFQHSLDKLINPSHLTTELLIEINQIDKAIESLNSIRGEQEKSKAYNSIIPALLAQDQEEKAIELIKNISNKQEKKREEFRLIQKFLGKGEIEKAMQFAKSSQDPEEVNNRISEVILYLAEKGELSQAQKLTNGIEDFDQKNYVLSRLANIASTKEMFDVAQKIAFEINDKGFREDAIFYILKKMLTLRKTEEAARLVESIKSPKERANATKLIESSKKALREDEKIKNLRRAFALMQTTTESQSSES